MAEKLFNKYYKRVAKEGIVKSFLIALCVGGGVLAISAFFSWFFAFKEGLYMSLALFVAFTGGLTPFIYSLKFRPTTKQIARRVDDLGLEERVLTMTELENDPSFIAMKQREDTVNALGRVNHMLLTLVVSTSLIVSAVVFGVVGLGMATVDVLYVAGMIDSGMVTLRPSVDAKTFVVSYGVDDNKTGTVYYYEEDKWDEMQVFEGEVEVEEGEKAPTVIALPAAGYVFVQWTDGSRIPYRADTVHNNINVEAIFESLPDLGVEDPELPEPDDLAPGSGEDSDDGGGGEDTAPPDSAGNENSADEGGGFRNSSSTWIFDGETFYGDDYSNAYDEAKDRLGSEGELSDEQKDWVNDYFESIEKGN